MCSFATRKFVSKVLTNSSQEETNSFFFYSMSCTNKLKPVRCNDEVWPGVAAVLAGVGR